MIKLSRSTRSLTRKQLMCKVVRISVFKLDNGTKVNQTDCCCGNCLKFSLPVRTSCTEYREGAVCFLSVKHADQLIRKTFAKLGTKNENIDTLRQIITYSKLFELVVRRFQLFLRSVLGIMNAQDCEYHRICSCQIILKIIVCRELPLYGIIN